MLALEVLKDNLVLQDYLVLLAVLVLIDFLALPGVLVLIPPCVQMSVAIGKLGIYSVL